MDSNLDPIQNNCIYGFVLPDRCRYNRRLGCACGAYPPVSVTAAQINSTEFPRAKRLAELEEEKECPKECRCEVCRFWGA